MTERVRRLSSAEQQQRDQQLRKQREKERIKQREKQRRRDERFNKGAVEYFAKKEAEQRAAEQLKQRQRLVRTLRPLDYKRDQHAEMALKQFLIFPEGDELALTLVTSAGSASIMLEKDLAGCLSRRLKRAVLERRSFTVSVEVQAESSPGRR